MSDPNDRRRPRWLAIAFTVLLGVIVAVTTQPPEGTAAGTILFGANPGLDEAGSRLAPLNDLEADLARDLDLVRVFERWDAQWDTPFHTAVEAGDTVMLLSVKAKRENNTNLLWNDIANAAVGSVLYNDIQMWIDRVANFDGEVWFTFHHEPEASVSEVHGNNTDFIAAWKRVIDEFRARGVGNVQFAWVMTYWSFATNPDDDGHADQWYPGDAYVDYIGSDAYNWNYCKGGTTDPWRSLEHQIEPQRQYGMDHPGKGLILAEWASDENAGDGGVAKSRWITDAAALFKQPGWEQFVGLAYFNIIANENHLGCNWLLDSSESARAAFVAMGADPFYGSPITLECNGRLATMVGSDGRDVLLGSNQTDVIVSLGGNDELTGSGGDDAICGGYGDDVIEGGTGGDFVAGSVGNDVVIGGAGPDTIYGGYGDDDLFGYGGNDFIDGGPGDDFATGNDGNDTLYGKEGADRLEAGNGTDTVHGGVDADFVAGGNDNDVVIGGAGPDTIYGGYGDDDLFGYGGNDFIDGGPGDDFATGNDGNDTLYGKEGADRLEAGNGTDTVHGGVDADFVAGGNDNDVVIGGAGPDTIYGGYGDDDLFGYGGNDFIDGGPGDDFATGNDGNDTLYGKEGADRLEAGNGTDTVHGGVDADFVAGGNDNDVVIGGAGPDTIYGGYGDDDLFGYGGNDFIDGGPGDDVLSGGIGADVCDGGPGTDVITGC